MASRLRANSVPLFFLNKKFDKAYFLHHHGVRMRNVYEARTKGSEFDDCFFHFSTMFDLNYSPEGIIKFM